jgi:hypothetical protein
MGSHNECSWSWNLPRLYSHIRSERSGLRGSLTKGNDVWKQVLEMNVRQGYVHQVCSLALVVQGVRRQNNGWFCDSCEGALVHRNIAVLID